jgi:hypothetical protein
MAKNLLIVESPAKAKTINKYLGKDFHVLASYGHVRDLVPKEGAVDPDHDFAMRYDLIDKNEKHVDAIAKAAKQADALYLATDLGPRRRGDQLAHRRNPAWNAAARRTRPASRGVLRNHADARSRKRSRIRVSCRTIWSMPSRRGVRWTTWSASTCHPVLWRKVQRGLVGRARAVARAAHDRRARGRDRSLQGARILDGGSGSRASPEQPFKARLLKLDGKKFEQFDLTDGERCGSRARCELLSAAHGMLQGRRCAVARSASVARSALHHLHPAAGSGTQARLRHQRTMRLAQQPVRRRGHRRGRRGRPDHLHAYRFHPSFRGSRRRTARGDRARYGRRRCRPNAEHLQDQIEERAGSA